MSKSKTTILSLSTTLSIVNELDKLARTIEEARKKIILSLPAKYGSRLWWEQGHIEAQEDIKAGRVYELKSIDDLDRYTRLTQVCSPNGRKS